MPRLSTASDRGEEVQDGARAGASQQTGRRPTISSGSGATFGASQCEHTTKMIDCTMPTGPRIRWHSTLAPHGRSGHHIGLPDDDETSQTCRDSKGSGPPGAPQTLGADCQSKSSRRFGPTSRAF